MYRQKVSEAGRVRLVQRYYPANYGAPGMAREKRRKPTTEEIRRQNQANKARKVQLLILGNFREGDWHLVLTYPKEGRPPDLQAAKEDLRKVLRKIGYRYKRAGIPFKWIAVTEIGKKGAAHHHLIIEDIRTEGFSSKRAVMECWHGGKAFYPLFEEGEYRELAEYLVKRDTKEDENGELSGTGYSHSRNLIPPKERIETKRAKRWRNPPRIPEGWELVKDSLHNGENPITGYPYQSFMIRKLPERVRRTGQRGGAG